MESAWQLCRVRWQWLADFTLITTARYLFLSLSLPSHHYTHTTFPFLPFLWLYSHFPFAVSSFLRLSSICLSLTTFLSNVFLGISTWGLFDSGHSEEHQKYFSLALFSLLSSFESKTLPSCFPSPLVLPRTFLACFISPYILSLPSLPSSLCPLGIELLIAFSMWKSLTSFSFVGALQSKGMSGCCSRGIRIGEYTGEQRL